MIDLQQDQMPLHGIDPLQGKKLFVQKRDGRVEEFNEARICLAIESAFKAVEGIGRDALLSGPHQLSVKKSADAVVERVLGRAVRGEQMEVERIQDAVEEQLMRDGHLRVARAYILYREKRRLARAEREGRLGAQVKLMPAPDSLRPKAIDPDLVKPARSKPPDETPARRFLGQIYSQALPKFPCDELEGVHRAQFSVYIEEAQYLDLLDPQLSDFDLDLLAGSLRLERDDLFPLSGLRALQDEFLLQDKGRCLETPQYFWMRLAMGLALNEGGQRNSRALEFYEVLSTFRFVPSEMILCHAGTRDPQLMTCCAATSWGDLEHVVAQFGPRLAPRKQTGSTCSWLEPWHIGIWNFLERARPGQPAWTHDLNKALWVPDLFMKRVRQQGPWTLFEPSQVPELHQQFGRLFERRYLEYEDKAQRGEIQGSQQVNATDLWQEILGSMAQTGQPWLGFKDAANIRSPQDHAGVVHCGTLCTAILLNTSPDEAASCGAGAINLPAHLDAAAPASLDILRVHETAGLALRMLDNAIDISAYPGEAARSASRQHRAASLGLFGFQHALDALNISYDSAAAADFSDRSMEIIAHAAILASTRLARERGVYPSYEGSKWSHGLVPIDTLPLLERDRDAAVDIDTSMTQNWEAVREVICRDGMRNCTTTGISVTDAASRLTGVSPSIEPANTAESKWLIECAARRQKWLDLGQALSLYTPDVDVETLSEMMLQAWEKGLKSTRQLFVRPRPAAEAPLVGNIVAEPVTAG